MYFKFLKFFLLTCLLGSSAISLCNANDTSEEDFYSCKPTTGEHDTWIGNMIQDGKYFEANIEVVDLQGDTATISLVDEVYDFTNKTGAIKFQHRFSNQEECVIEYAKYFNNQAYISSNNTATCGRKPIDDTEVLKKFMLRWLPDEVFADGQKIAYNQLLGPSSMLLHLNNKMDQTHRYQFTDSERIWNSVFNLCIQDKFMIKFHNVKDKFPDESSERFFIKTIQILEKEKEKTEEKPKWKLRTQFNYYYVAVSKDIHLDDNLPLGLGCSREATDFKNPQIDNQQFELDFQFIRNQAESYKNEQSINHFDPTRSLLEHHKLYLDHIHHLAVNFKQDSSSKVTKQVHDFTIHLTYAIDMVTGVCSKTVDNNGEGSVYVNFDDPLSIVKNIDQVLKLGEKNNFIGTFYTRMIECKVYETTFNMVVNNQNQSFIVTHYYSSYNFKPESTDKLPIRIDLKQFKDDKFKVQLGYFVFMINKFYPALDFGKQEIFDISYCMPHYYQYSWFLIEFDCKAEEINKLKNAQLALIDEFTKRLGITALRLPKILVDFDDTTVYFTTKLLEVPAINEHFEVDKGKNLVKAPIKYLSDHEENCAKSCFNNADCVAFSYCSNMECSQLMLDNYSSDKTTIPDDYIKSEEDSSCNLQKRKFKLKRDDVSSRDIRSVMSDLNKKVNSGKFNFNVKVSRSDEEEEKIDLKASQIVMNVDPGSRQSNNVNDELMRGTSENYERFFSIHKSNNRFDSKKLKQAKEKFIYTQSDLSLADCELQCMNNLNCHSFSHCKNNICLLTSASDAKTIEESLSPQVGCFVSKKNYLSNYAVHDNRGIKNIARKKVVLSKVEEETPETCAKLCSSSKDTDNYECLSFEYCDAKKRDVDASEKVCLLHEINLQSEHEQKLEWDFEKTYCNHYTKKHSTDYKEYSMQKLIKYDLIEHTKVPLEKCATMCDEHELCNTFDYCFEQSEHGVVDNQNIRCRLHTDTYSVTNVKMNSATCSVYETMNPKIPVKINVHKKRTYSKGLTVALSFVALISGSSIGVLLSFLVIRRCFSKDEDDE